MRHSTESARAADESEWGSDDMSILRALLGTPEPRNGSSSRSGRESTVEMSPSSRESIDEKDIATGEVVLTALRRQVVLLQQEYDRYLEQRVAKSIVAAGGRTAPRAAAIKLYRQYERLARVTESLKLENQRLEALLADRERHHLTGQALELENEQSFTQQPTRDEHSEMDEAADKATLEYSQADPKEPPTRKGKREEI